jgi:hypothetical protein
MLPPIAHRIATELAVNPRQVEAAVALLDEGATVPFIARYRKEVTGGLDDTQLRTLEERLGYLRELEERRTAIVASIGEQGKLTPELRAQSESAARRRRSPARPVSNLSRSAFWKTRRWSPMRRPRSSSVNRSPRPTATTRACPTSRPHSRAPVRSSWSVLRNRQTCWRA